MVVSKAGSRIGRLATLAVGLAACAEPCPPPQVPSAPADSPCPAELPASQKLPGTLPEHRTPGFWIARQASPDELLLSEAEIAELNRRGRARWREDDFGFRRDVTAGPISAAPVLAQLRRDIVAIRGLVAAGDRVLLDGRRPSAGLLDGVERIVAAGTPAGELRVAVELVPLRSLPMAEGLYEKAGDVDFDLMHASTVRPGELVRVVSRHPERWQLVRSEYAYGWVRGGGLSQPIDEGRARSYRWAERPVVVTADRAPVWRTPERRQPLVAAHVGLAMPLLDGPGPAADLVQVLAPSPAGLEPGWIAREDVHEGPLPLTRRNLVRHAFRRLDDRFGWGGMEGDRDCSRFLMDLLALFGLELPRNSRFQAQAGLPTIDVAALSVDDKRQRLEQASTRGVVLAFMPGHIMLILGKDRGRFFAIHQFSGYRVPCRPGVDTKMVVSRVAVSDLHLGRGSARKSFLERLDKLIVIGRPAGS